ncbi:PilW family protein [Variovorax sp. JS1663]|uniref:PilW family protein n=1 Tax=Variovorax sp. JS1663 TaxID=1851577 RepID=UPI000B34A054|nr:PilW family protein [Variovorax sp. JS1663]
MTLVELLVAMIVGMLVVLATVAALTVTRRGFTAVDAASQLRDNGRFAAELIQRVSIQAGYRDVSFASGTRKTPPSTDPPPDVSGFNNAALDASNPLTAWSSRNSSVAGYGSDVLILRYQASQLRSQSADLTSDKSMIDCAGNPVLSVPDPASPDARDTRMVSIFHVDVRQDEPTLMCTYQNVSGGFTTVPLIQGVEQFQLLYGVDGVTPGTAPASGASAPDVAKAYLRADELVVAGDAAGTNANWRRVRSIRVGLVLRGAAGSSQTVETQTFYPFGASQSSATAAKGSAFASAADTNSTFSAPADGRLRQSLTFTIHLRNDQGLGYAP